MPARAIEAYTCGFAGRAVRATRGLGPPFHPLTVCFLSYRSYMKLFDFSVPALRALMSGALALAVSSTAFAHAHLVSSVPSANAEVAAPGDVTIHFTEPLEPAFSKITLADASGKPATATASEVDGQDARVMHLALPQLGVGRYAVHWIAVATDGHRTQGDFAFNVK